MPSSSLVEIELELEVGVDFGGQVEDEFWVEVEVGF